MVDQYHDITILTEYFYPEEASTAQLLTELAGGLSESFSVSVITAYPNYHEGDERKVVAASSIHEGVEISRVRSTGFDKDSLPLRIMNWVTFTFLTLVRLFRAHRSDGVLLVLSNPPILPFAAWIHKRLTGTPYTYLIYDMYPDMPSALGMISRDGVVANFWERAMKIVYRDADSIVVLGESMRSRLEDKMDNDPGFDKSKIAIIPNWEDDQFIRPRAKSENQFAREQGTVDTFTLVYSGNIGRFHELETAIDAMGELEARGREDIQLLIIGEGARKKELEGYVERKKIENVHFLPFQPRDRLPETLTCGDASLVGIQPEIEGMCVSSKLYSALAAGVPVLSVVGQGDEVARVVRECDCGAYVRPGDVESVADVLLTWADNRDHTADLGRNARECFEENYTLSQAIDSYTTLLGEFVRE